MAESIRVMRGVSSQQEALAESGVDPSQEESPYKDFDAHGKLPPNWYGPMFTSSQCM